MALTNWLELPSDIMVNILSRVGVVDIFENAQKVCTTWLKICTDHPALWRVIKMDGFSYYYERPRLREICKRAVDRSQGQLVDLTIEDFFNAELLQYVADRSSQLRRLEMAFCFDDMNETWNEALKKFPLLEELSLYKTKISKEAIETAGRFCPMLKTLKVNRRGYTWFMDADDEPADASLKTWNEFAKAIGENLFNLRHLELIGCSMSNVGLQFILDGCCHLESLDLRICWRLYLKEGILETCLEQIKHLKLPSDSLEGCPHLYAYTKPGLVCDEDHFNDIDIDEQCKFNSKMAGKLSQMLAEDIMLLVKEIGPF